jgi:hypothetical protein
MAEGDVKGQPDAGPRAQGEAGEGLDGRDREPGFSHRTRFPCTPCPCKAIALAYVPRVCRLQTGKALAAVIALMSPRALPLHTHPSLTLLSDSGIGLEHRLGCESVV